MDGRMDGRRRRRRRRWRRPLPWGKSRVHSSSKQASSLASSLARLPSRAPSSPLAHIWPGPGPPRPRPRAEGRKEVGKSDALGWGRGGEGRGEGGSVVLGRFGRIAAVLFRPNAGKRRVTSVTTDDHWGNFANLGSGSPRHAITHVPRARMHCPAPPPLAARQPPRRLQPEAGHLDRVQRRRCDRLRDRRLDRDRR